MIITRVFSPTDIPAVTRIVKESLGEQYPPSLYLTVHNLWREGFMVAVENGEIVAFLAAVPTGAKVARVLMLAVAKSKRRMSLGRVLMQVLYENAAARGLDTVILEVRKSNRTAIAFYEREGFQSFGEISNFYSNGEDAWKLMKVLQS